MPSLRSLALLVSSLALPAFAQSTFNLSLHVPNGQARGGAVNEVQLRVDNHGPTTSTQFTLNVSVSGGTIYNARFGCTHTASTVQCVHSPLWAGMDAVYYLDIFVPTSSSSMIIDANLTVADSNASDNQGTGTFLVTQQRRVTDFAVTADNGAVTLSHGQSTTFTFRVTNHGPDPSYHFTVRGAPPQIEVRDVWTSTNTSCSDPPWLFCLIDALAPGQSRDVYVQVRGSAPGLFPVALGIDTRFPDSTDPSSVNDNATVVVEVTGPPAPPKSSDLAVVLQPATPTVSLNGTTTFVATVRNDGPDAAELVSLTATLPPQLELTAATSAGATCSRSGNEALCVLPAIPSGSTATMTLTAIARSAGNATATATASIATDPNAANNSGSATVNVIAGRSRPTRRF